MATRTHFGGIVSHERIRAVEELLSRRRVLILLTVGPAALLFISVNLFPIAWVMRASLFEINPFSADWQYVGLENHAQLLTDPEFYATIYRTVIWVVGSVALQVVAGTGLALLINRSFRYENFVRALALLPYLIPTAILGFVGKWMANSQSGIINQLLYDMGLITEYMAWYGSYDLAMIAAIVTGSWKFAIFVTIMVLARLQSIPEGLYEAAAMSGATAYQRFRDITYPNLQGVLAIVILLRGVWMFNKFDIPYVLTTGGPEGQTTIMAIFAYKKAFVELSLGYAASIAVVIFVMLVVVAIFYFWRFKPSEAVRVE